MIHDIFSYKKTNKKLTVLVIVFNDKACNIMGFLGAKETTVWYVGLLGKVQNKCPAQGF